MNISKKSIIRKGATLALMTAIVFGTSVPAHAQQGVTQEIGAGSYTGASGMTVAPAFAPIVSTRALQPVTSTNFALSTLVVDDASGATLGWSVTMEASDLVDSVSDTYTIPASAVSVTLGTVTATAGGSNTNVTKPFTAIGVEDGVKVLSATAVTTPSGIYTTPVTLNIAVPANVHTGTYEGTITTTNTQAP